MYEHRTRRRVEFSDTDAAGIVHFSRFFVFMESAEHAFWRALGTSVHSIWDGRSIGWPRLKATCEFSRPVRFEDELDIRVAVARKGARSLTFCVELEHEGRRVAAGELITACCELRPGQRPRAIDIPRALAERIEVAPEFANGGPEGARVAAGVEEGDRR